MTVDFCSLLPQLAESSLELESGDSDWPLRQLNLLADAGILGAVIPQEYGGSEISAAELTAGYVRLASACLTTTFVLTQRNGACQRIAGSQNESLKAEVLSSLCTSEVFATVGISHLTTSRQHLREPAIRASRREDGYRLNGTAPWVTGAKHADFILTGGTCEDGRQILAVVETAQRGVTVNAPPKLLAMNSSQTGSVTFDDVLIDEQRVIAGPVELVMKQGVGGGAGSLTTSALAIGAAAGTLQRLKDECENRPALLEIYEPLAGEHAALESDLFAAADGVPSAESIRTRANSLVLRAAHALLTAAKGAGFVAGHPAERAIREATFFLVWSCPQPVQTAAMREFACVVES